MFGKFSLSLLGHWHLQFGLNIPGLPVGHELWIRGLPTPHPFLSLPPIPLNMQTFWV